MRHRLFRRPVLLSAWCLGWLALMPLAQGGVPSSPCARSAEAIPPRPPGASSPGAFMASIAGLGDRARDAAIRDELIAGNLPPFLRHALPATLTARLVDGRSVQLTLCVLSDYLGLGSDVDFMPLPMGLPSALAVASRFGFTLPTRRIVDLIYRQAAVQLRPQPLPAGDLMRSTAYLRWHQGLVTQQRTEVGAWAGALTAGHKKDLVLSPRLWQQPGRVAIYGWQRADGTPIQPLSTVHGAHYADYSHGVRLVSQTAFLDGQPKSLFDLLADPQLAPLLSDEGPLPRLAAWQSAQSARDAGAN